MGDTINQSVWDIDFTVTIDGNDYTSYIVEIDYKVGLCSPGATLNLVVAPNCPYTPDTYEDITIDIEGTRVFTGYTQQNNRSRTPVNFVVRCEDAIARVRDTWTTDMQLASQGESVGYWIGYFLNQAGVTYSVSSGGPPTPEKDFGFVNCLSEIRSLLIYENWQLSVDENDKVWVKSHTVAPAAAYEVEFLNYDRYQSDHWLRNRAVVIGYNEESSVDRMSYVEELNDNGEIRTGIVASPEIVWPATAEAMAWRILTEFAEPWDVRTLTVIGIPAMRLGDTAHVVHDWNGDDHYGLITSMQWSINASTGYTQQITLDEHCPSFWLSDTRPNILYCATEGAGVWKSYDDGVNWFDISGSELDTGLPSYVKDIYVVQGPESVIGTDDTVWAATLGGVFKTDTGAAPWTNITEEFMDSKAQYMDWWGVLCDWDADRVYCVGNYAAGDTYIYDDAGNVQSTIPARGVIYMYISLDGGETWDSYLVNPYTLEV